MAIAQHRLLFRRAVATQLALGGITALLATRTASVVAAQEASPAASRSIPPLLAEWAAAWSSHDPDRVAALYAPDAVYEEIPTGTIARGHEAIRDHVAASHADFADIRVTPRAGFQAEAWAVLEGDFSARSAEGKPIAVPFALVLELEGDTIRRSADYFDLNAVLTQMGATEEPATPTE